MPKVCSLADIHGIRRALLVVILAFLSAAGPLCTDMYLPALPTIAKDFSIPAAMTQASITSCLLGLALGQLFIGPMSDSTGRKGILLVSLAVFSLASYFCTRVTSGEAFLAMRFLEGVGGAGGAVLSRAISCDSFSGARLTAFMSLFMGIHGIAPVAGPVVGGFISTLAGWRGVFYLLTAMSLILMFLCLLLMPETLAHRIRGGLLAPFRNMARLFREPAFLCYTGVQAFTAAGFFCYIAASPFLFQSMYGFSATEYSFIFGINSLILVISTLLTGILSRRFGDRRLLITGNTVRTAGCFVLLAVAILRPSSPIPLMASLAIMLFAQGFTLTTSFTLAIMSQHVGAGAASGILGVALFISGAAASPVAGVMGPMSALPLGILCAVTGTLSLLCAIAGNRAYLRNLGESHTIGK